jgi:uncharacterized protein (UPF0212 family)
METSSIFLLANLLLLILILILLVFSAKARIERQSSNKVTRELQKIKKQII